MHACGIFQLIDLWLRCEDVVILLISVVVTFLPALLAIWSVCLKYIKARAAD